jgi:O-methyltransferase
MTKEACSSCPLDENSCIVECGVAGGGSSIVMAVAACHYSPHPLRVYSFDTFCGMPPPSAHDIRVGGVWAGDSGWGEGTCSAPLANIVRLAKNFSVDVQPIEGLFDDTLPTFRSGCSNGMRIAALHIDADWYASTMSALTHLYPLVVQNGAVQIDDYKYWEGCGRAVKSFFAVDQGFYEPRWTEIDGNAVWGRKV